MSLLFLHSLFLIFPDVQYKTIRILFPGQITCNARDFQYDTDDRNSLVLRTNFKFNGVKLAHKDKKGKPIFQVTCAVWWKLAINGPEESASMKSGKPKSKPADEDFSSMTKFMNQI